MEWARRLERIERAKAEERMKDPTQNFAEGKGETNEIVAKQTGFGNRENYRKAKFIADHADEETIRQLDAARKGCPKGRLDFFSPKVSQNRQCLASICGREVNFAESVPNREKKLGTRK